VVGPFRRKLRWQSAGRIALLLTSSVVLTGCLGWWPQLLTSDGSALRGIACPTATTCVAVGVTSSGSNGLIETTADGGGHWSSVSVASPLDAVSCGDSEHCVAVGAGGAFFTGDGGKSWVPAASGPSSSGGSVSCPSSDDCWAFGPSQGTMIASTDGGSSWTAESWTAPSQTSGFGGGPYTFSYATLLSIDCPSTTVCVAVGRAIYTWTPSPETTLPQQTEGIPIVITTHDGGQTWSAQLGPNNGGISDGFFRVSCTSSQQCLVTGTSGGQLTSNDGGATWSGSWSGRPTQFAANGLFCVNASDCLEVGNSLDGKYGSPVMVTSDGGTTWAPQALPDSTAQLQSVACVSVTSCWAAGETPAGAIVIRTLTGGHAWPEVSGISPVTGSSAGGTAVTITGTHLNLGVVSVSFGTTVTTAFTVNSPTQITVTSPPMASGSTQTVDVTVNSLLGPSPLTPDDQFSYVPVTLAAPYAAAAKQEGCFNGNGACSTDSSADATTGSIGASDSESATSAVPADGSANGTAWGQVTGSFTLGAPVTSLTFHAVVALSSGSVGHSGATTSSDSSAVLNLLYGAADSTCAGAGCTLSSSAAILSVSGGVSQSVGSRAVTQDFTLTNLAGGALPVGTITVTIGLAGQSMLGAGDIGTEVVNGSGTVQSITISVAP